MGTAKPLLTPKELADAIGASESSVRRWVDAGDLRMSRTAGGHRRIPLAEAVRFIRKLGAPVVRPDLLGFEGAGAGDDDAAAHAEGGPLFQALYACDRRAAESLLVSWYLRGRGLPELFDAPVRDALHRLGSLWEHDERGILVEHRATAVCVEAVATLRGLLPPPDGRAPLALGGAPEGDPYLLPSMMAAAVLAEAGWREVNFGAATPVRLLGEEAVARGAKLVWLSLSAPADARTLRPSLGRLADVLAENDAHLVVGGRHSGEHAPRGRDNVSTAGSMAELAKLANSLRGAARRVRRAAAGHPK